MNDSNEEYFELVDKEMEELRNVMIKFVEG